jgi:hypothetical protein
MKLKKHKYKLVIEFETEKAVKMQESRMIQYENCLEYFVYVPNLKHSINETYIYGTGKARLKKRGSK